jgi:ABC-type microcin C transport system duplicated ATPase subunit YejF
MSDTILQLTDVKTHFPITQGFLLKRHIGTVKAVDGVNLTVRRGEVLGLVGESGCGKSTLARTILQLVPTTGGTVVLNGRNLADSSARELLAARRDLQMVFQDPYGSLSPRMTVGEIVSEGLRLHHPHWTPAQTEQRVREALAEVGLVGESFADLLNRYPHAFSGGQRQRIALARALVVEPDLLVLDEPTSALDVTVQKQILELLQVVQKNRGTAYLLITHDVDVLRAMAHEVVVLKSGRVVEQGAADQVLGKPQHEYTRTLVQAFPDLT